MVSLKFEMWIVEILLAMESLRGEDNLKSTNLIAKYPIKSVNFLYHDERATLSSYKAF